MDHKTSLKSLGYIYSNSQQYIMVNIFILCQKSLGCQEKLMFHEDI